MNLLNEHTIQGVTFEAVRLDSPRVPGSHYYRAKVKQTGVILSQDYHTRPAMWADLDKCARLCGERFARDTLAAL